MSDTIETTAPAAKTMRLKKARVAKPVDAKTAAPKTSAKAAKGAARPVEKAAKPQRPQTVLHQIEASWSGPSTVMNARVSKTPLNFAKFGTLSNAALTDRDRKSLADLRAAFQKKVFTRVNVDAGILRRLGERGLLEHVSGSDVASDASFKLTARAFTPEAMAA